MALCYSPTPHPAVDAFVLRDERRVLLVEGSHPLAARSELAVEIQGEDGLDRESDWTYRFLRSRANSIEGGTTEILKNIVAERVLGLPRA